MEAVSVLVVDDSLVIRGLISSLLEQDPQITVVAAVATADEAENVLRNNIIDVVTLDIVMPGRSGLDYLPTLTKRRIPVVMLSGKTSESSSETELALRCGAFACFDKSQATMRTKDLQECVKQAAKQRSKLPDVAPDDEAAADQMDVLLRRLIEAHGGDLRRVFAEKIGYAMLDDDKSAVEAWIAIARRHEELNTEPSVDTWTVGPPYSAQSASRSAVGNC